MSNQDIINRAVLGIRKQGFRCFDEYTGTCSYRGQDGAKCIAGYALPDEEYDPHYDEDGINANEIKYFYEAGLGALMYDLQKIHDDSYAWADGVPEARFKQLVESHGYTYPDNKEG